MKKKIIIFTGISFLVLIIFYINTIRFYTGIGTSYNFFNATKNKNKEILIFYFGGGGFPFVYVNLDSIQKKYGFKYERTRENVNFKILDYYNNIIQKELIRRIGIVGWNNYQKKQDSIYRAEAKKIYGIDFK